jgi:hypothetical protein
MVLDVPAITMGGLMRLREAGATKYEIREAWQSDTTAQCPDPSTS